MKELSTYRNSILSGIVSGIGLQTVQFITENYQLEDSSGIILNLTSACILFVFPIIVFVVGTQHVKFNFRYSFSKEYLAVLPKIYGRMFSWFIFCGLFGALSSSFYDFYL